METGDPDDVMTLAMLATHPRVRLTGVTVMPGDPEQVLLVRRILSFLGKGSVPVGGSLSAAPARRVSPFYTRWLASCGVPSVEAEPVIEASKVLRVSIDQQAHLLTGAALTNIWNFYQEVVWVTRRNPLFESWTCQGGFAGDNVVPVEDRLEKFNGMLTCPTYNLNGNPKAAEGLLAQPSMMGPIRLVSKNVCHGFLCEWEDAVIKKDMHPGLVLMLRGTQMYLSDKKKPKALHDTLAAALMLDPWAGTWVRGTPYREKGKWGFTPDPKGHVEIVTKVDRKAIWQAFCE